MYVIDMQMIMFAHILRLYFDRGILNFRITESQSVVRKQKVT